MPTVEEMNDVAPALQASRSVSSATPAGRDEWRPTKAVLLLWAVSYFCEASQMALPFWWGFLAPLPSLALASWLILNLTADRKNEDRSERAQPGANTNMEGE